MSMQWNYILKTLKFTIISQFILNYHQYKWYCQNLAAAAEPLGSARGGLRGAQVGNLWLTEYFVLWLLIYKINKKNLKSVWLPAVHDTMYATQNTCNRFLLQELTGPQQDVSRSLGNMRGRYVAQKSCMTLRNVLVGLLPWGFLGL